jgi:predicted aldo/keto reductase-like oxidoreductase
LVAWFVSKTGTVVQVLAGSTSDRSENLPDKEPCHLRFDRRDLLKNLLTAAFTVPISGGFSEKNPRGRSADVGVSGIKKYQRLGKTELEVSDIGFGVSVSTDPKLLVEAFRRGINYFDLSPFYSWSTRMLAEAFRIDDDMRRKAIVASKVECDNLFYLSSRKPLHQVIIECVDKTLKQLGRDFFDIMQIHSVGEGGEEDLDWLDTDKRLGAEAARLFEILKRDGKLRYTGLSTHGPRLLETVIERAVTSGRFDMMMIALNFMQSPGLGAALRAADQADAGLIAMKVLANARALKISTPAGTPIAQAAIKWALAQPGIDGVAITIPDRATLDAYLGASGGQLSLVDQFLLTCVRMASSRYYCRVGCGACMKSCPAGVEIATLLRIDQYRTDYGLLGQARERYGLLPEQKRPYACSDCRTRKCETACPFAIPIRSRLLTAWRHLDPSTIAS